MSQQPPLNSPYLRNQRHFPQDRPQALVVELDKMYIDIANRVNERTIGVFPLNRSAITGENWFLSGPNQNQQGLRQVFTFTSAGNIPHGLNLAQIDSFIRIWGTFFDGTTWYPLPYVDTTSATNQVSVVVNATNIVITAGAGSPPSITSGIVVLEWLANV